MVARLLPLLLLGACAVSDAYPAVRPPAPALQVVPLARPHRVPRAPSSVLAPEVPAKAMLPPPFPRAELLHGQRNDGEPVAELSRDRSEFRALLQSVTEQQRQQLLVLMVAGATLNMAAGVVLPTFPSLALDLGLGAAGVSVLVAIPSAIRLLLNLFMGQQADKRGRVPLMVVGELLAGVGVACTGLASSLFAIVPARILVGIGGSMSGAGWHAYLADLTQQPNLLPHRGVIMGVESSVAAAAWIAGPALGGFVCERYGPRLGFLLVGVAMTACGALLATLPETLRNKAKAGAKAVDGEELSRQGLLTLLSNRNQQGVLASHFCLSLNYAANTVVIPLLAKAMWDATAGQIGLLFSFLSIMSLVAAPLAGLLADTYRRKSVIVPSLLLMGVGSAIIGMARTLPVFLAASILWSAGEAFFVPATNALTADCAPEGQKGEALALSRQVGDLGYCLGPLLIGTLYDLGGPAMALAVLCLINFSAAALVAARVQEAPLGAPSVPSLASSEGEGFVLALQA
eukprot:EG_transcript_6767